MQNLKKLLKIQDQIEGQIDLYPIFFVSETVTTKTSISTTVMRQVLLVKIIRHIQDGSIYSQ